MNQLVAIWEPAWYELDQPLTVGEVATVVLVTSSLPMRFATYMLDAGVERLEVQAEVVSIYNKQLGDIAKIDTQGLTYKFYVDSETFFQIEAEETPGWIENSDAPDDFLLEMEFLVCLSLLDSSLILPK
jgi:hypothetical protein